jgi:hypothetical protein
LLILVALGLALAICFQVFDQSGGTTGSDCPPPGKSDKACVD